MLDLQPEPDKTGSFSLHRTLLKTWVLFSKVKSSGYHAPAKGAFAKPIVLSQEVVLPVSFLGRHHGENCGSMQALQLGRRELLAYQGHPLRRPIASNEIAWLARLLVRASDAANTALGLDRRATEQETGEGGSVQVLPTLSMTPCDICHSWLYRSVISVMGSAEEDSTCVES